MSEGRARELLINRGMSPQDADLKMSDYMGVFATGSEYHMVFDSSLEEEEEAGLIDVIEDIQVDGTSLFYVWEN